jgi:tetratricopeptide (TPR) repeat protein
MKHRTSLSAFVLLSVVSLFGQGATPPEQAESHVGDSAAPDSLESLKTLADSKLSVEHNKEVTVEQDAVAAAKEAIRADPTDGFAWSKLGDAYFQLGDYKNAKDATEKAIEIFTERFRKAPSPAECEGMKILSERQQPNGPARIVCHDEASTNLSMLASSYVQMATICHRLHKKREASRYENLALRAFDVMRLMQPSSRLPATNAQVQHSQNNGAPRPTQTAPVSPPRPALTPAPPVPQCQLPVHELCQYPTFRPQPYDPNNPHPYVAPDTRDYDRCVVGNQREDARYQQCLQKQQWEQQREQRERQDN